MSNRFDAATLEAIAFIGNTLSPLFLEDPVKGDQAVYSAFKALDADAAAAEWPFAEPTLAAECLSTMVRELNNTPAADLAHDFRTMFVGPFKKTCPPWGSVYMDHEGVTFGPTTLALRKWMRKTGIERVQDERMPDDHIGYLLSMMAWTALNRPEALEELLTEHLLTWAAHFFNLMENSAEQAFYIALARLTRDSLEGIQEIAGLEVETPRFFR